MHLLVCQGRRHSRLRRDHAAELPGAARARAARALQRTISRSDAFRGVHRRELLAISHRWESPEAPDGLGVQMGALRKRLAERQEIELVWYDYWCMAQDERSAEERQTGRRGDTRSPAAIALFKHMLKNVNLLYLGCSVLCLVDISYLSRFWVRDRR